MHHPISTGTSGVYQLILRSTNKASCVCVSSIHIMAIDQHVLFSVGTVLTNETCRKIAAKKQRDHGQVTIQFRIQNSLISSR